ncbi:unnamed protein product [Diplocarpon coronariae]
MHEKCPIASDNKSDRRITESWARLCRHAQDCPPSSHVSSDSVQQLNGQIQVNSYFTTKMSTPAFTTEFNSLTSVVHYILTHITEHRHTELNGTITSIFLLRRYSLHFTSW